MTVKISHWSKYIRHYDKYKFNLTYRGYLGPGGLENCSKHFNCTGGAAGYIDRKVLGEKHIFGSPTCKVLWFVFVI